MPIYEYECQACGQVLDALQKVSDEPLVHCPSCGEGALKKLISAPRFRLKGSGWYETDFKDKNRRNIASGDSGASDTSATSGSSAKPAKADVKKSDTPAASPSTGSGGGKSGGSSGGSGKSDASGS
jgi:putative FmdB family regulatory protein